jgi:hypothetical protein
LILQAQEKKGQRAGGENTTEWNMTPSDQDVIGASSNYNSLAMLDRFIGFVEKEWGVLKTAPFTFVMLAVLCLGLGYGGGMLYYSSQIGSLREQLSAKDGQLGRYRVALGIDPASKGALVELNNQELALKAASIVSKIREVGSREAARLQGIQKEVDSGKLNKDEASKQQFAVSDDVSKEFDRTIASEAYNVLDALYKRLDPVAIAHVIRVPGFIDSSGTRISITEIMRASGMDTLYFPTLADEIEQMAKLLPPDSGKP